MLLRKGRLDPRFRGDDRRGGGDLSFALSEERNADGLVPPCHSRASGNPVDKPGARGLDPRLRGNDKGEAASLCYGEGWNADDLPLLVIPAKAGIQSTSPAQAT